MKNKLFFTSVSIGMVFLFFSCKTNNNLPEKRYSSDKSCDNYYQFLKTSWHKKEDGLFGFNSEPLYDKDLPGAYQLVNRPCLQGLSMKNIINLYGEPTVKNEEKFEYFMTEECHQGENQCLKMQFFFDKNGTVEKTPLLTTSKNPTGFEVKER